MIRRLRSALAIGIALLLSGGTPVWAQLSAKGLDMTQFTSDFMIGSVAVSVIFPESDGTLDPSTENWSPERQAQVMSKIMSGFDWWTRQNPRSPLSFTFVSQTVNTRYEPITRSYYDESLWIPEIMGKLGYSGSRFTSTRAYANALRTQLGTDWALVVFVVDSLNDADGKMADGLFGYAYLGGPYMVMTYDNNGYGIANMDVVAAHELGHIFNALDEYAGASSPNDYSFGYFPTINGNHDYASTANEPNSIMKGGIRWGLDSWARQMVGWRDADNNGRDDIIDQNPIVVVNPPAASASDGSVDVSGQAQIAYLPRQGNASGYGLNVDSIANVQYRSGGGDWSNAQPSDGGFDSNNESFQIVLPASTNSTTNASAADGLEVRAVTVMSTESGSSTASHTAPSSLADAYAYPNPFKPTLIPTHTAITFTGLTPGAKVQIFSSAGEAVYKDDADPSTNQVIWKAKNTDGQDVASGVYYYLITDETGGKKEGKVAVIR